MARTSKSKARLQRLEALREREPELLETEPLSLDFAAALGGARLGHVLLETEGLARRLGGRTLFEGLDLVVQRGDRIGVLGPNGCGKSTLLRCLAGRDEPDEGRIFRAPRLKLAFFEQERRGLDPRDTVFQAVGGGNDYVRVAGRPVHVASYLQRFLFAREMLDQPVSTLSGGERARLLLARLLLEGANVLLLDEPTNDLDLETLRVLEEALLSFPGASIVVTHDRALLDRVCNAVLAFEPDGRVRRYGSREQALRALEAWEERTEARPKPPPPRRRERSRARKLSYREQRELEALPGRIEEVEAEKEEVEARLGDPATYRSGGEEVARLRRHHAELEAELEALYARWEELEERARG